MYLAVELRLTKSWGGFMYMLHKKCEHCPPVNGGAVTHPTMRQDMHRVRTT